MYCAIVKNTILITLTGCLLTACGGNGGLDVSQSFSSFISGGGVIESDDGVGGTSFDRLFESLMALDAFKLLLVVVVLLHAIFEIELDDGFSAFVVDDDDDDIIVCVGGVVPDAVFVELIIETRSI